MSGGQPAGRESEESGDRGCAAPPTSLARRPLLRRPPGFPVRDALGARPPLLRPLPPLPRLGTAQNPSLEHSIRVDDAPGAHPCRRPSRSSVAAPRPWWLGASRGAAARVSRSRAPIGDLLADERREEKDASRAEVGELAGAPTAARARGSAERGRGKGWGEEGARARSGRARPGPPRRSRVPLLLPSSCFPAPASRPRVRSLRLLIRSATSGTDRASVFPPCWYGSRVARGEERGYRVRREGGRGETRRFGGRGRPLRGVVVFDARREGHASVLDCRKEAAERAWRARGSERRRGELAAPLPLAVGRGAFWVLSHVTAFAPPLRRARLRSRPASPPPPSPPPPILLRPRWRSSVPSSSLRWR